MAVKKAAKTVARVQQNLRTPPPPPIRSNPPIAAQPVQRAAPPPVVARPAPAPIMRAPAPVVPPRPQPQPQTRPAPQPQPVARAQPRTVTPPTPPRKVTPAPQPRPQPAPIQRAPIQVAPPAMTPEQQRADLMRRYQAEQEAQKAVQEAQMRQRLDRLTPEQRAQIGRPPVQGPTTDNRILPVRELPGQLGPGILPPDLGPGAPRDPRTGLPPGVEIRGGPVIVPEGKMLSPEELGLRFAQIFHDVEPPAGERLRTGQPVMVDNGQGSGGFMSGGRGGRPNPIFEDPVLADQWRKDQDQQYFQRLGMPPGPTPPTNALTEYVFALKDPATKAALIAEMAQQGQAPSNMRSAWENLINFNLTPEQYARYKADTRFDDVAIPLANLPNTFHLDMGGAFRDRAMAGQPGQTPPAIALPPGMPPQVYFDPLAQLQTPQPTPMSGPQVQPPQMTAQASLDPLASQMSQYLGIAQNFNK